MRLAWPVAGRDRPLDLEAAYPDSFPRLRPTVRLATPQQEYPARHCSPSDGVLCLLGRDSAQWTPSWTLRKLLDEQLEDALNGTGVEDPQGEPADYWWNALGLPDSFCLVDSRWSLPDAEKGTLTLRFDCTWKDNRPRIRAVVAAIDDETGDRIATWDNPLPQYLEAESAKTLTVPWVRSDQPVLPDGSSEQISELVKRNSTRPSQTLGFTRQLRCVGLLFESELGPDRTGLSFAFPLLYGSVKQMQGRDKRKRPRAAVLPTLRAGDEDRAARVPPGQGLQQKRIAVFGLGALGAPLAVELARNGCATLHMIDHDIVEPGNSVRWPLGASAWGSRKAYALHDFIAREYPDTVSIPYHHHLGLPAPPSGEDRGDSDVLNAVLGNADLVVDATAAHGVTGILSDYCRERHLPMVSLFASASLEGGVVARFGADGGCPTCLEFAWQAGTIPKPRGLGSEAGMQQPPGCAERTFTGASYDLQELTLQAMRTIVRTINASSTADQSLVFTLSLADATGPIPPSWQSHALSAQAGCTCTGAP